MRISFTGDLLAYRNLIKKSRTKQGYDFSKVFEKVHSIFAHSDYVVGNLETPLAGGKCGYTEMDMLFNTGLDGLKRTIDVLDKLGVDHTGTFKSQTEPHFLVKEIKGVKIGFISLTYGTNPNVNGYALDSNSEYLVNLTKKSDEPYKRPFWKQKLIAIVYHLPLSVQNVIHPLYPNHGYDDNVNESEIGKEDSIRFVLKMKELIANTKKESDITVVCLHAGGQFNSEVGAYTKYLIKEIKSLSVDALIVNHPHCVLGSQFKENMFEAWSLGNFCFTPNEGYFIDGVYGEYGVIVHLEIDSVKKKIIDVLFSVVKNVRLEDGREQVIPITILYNEYMIEKEKNLLKEDIRMVISRFLQKPIVSVAIKDEYNYNDL